MTSLFTIFATKPKLNRTLEINVTLTVKCNSNKMILFLSKVLYLRCNNAVERFE